MQEGLSGNCPHCGACSKMWGTAWPVVEKPANIAHLLPDKFKCFACGSIFDVDALAPYKLPDLPPSRFDRGGGPGTQCI